MSSVYPRDGAELFRQWALRSSFPVVSEIVSIFSCYFVVLFWILIQNLCKIWISYFECKFVVVWFWGFERFLFPMRAWWNSLLRSLDFNLQMTSGIIGRSHKWWEKGIQPNMKEVTSAQDLVDSLANAGNKLVVLEFFSPGCGGCKALHPKVRLLIYNWSLFLAWDLTIFDMLFELLGLLNGWSLFCWMNRFVNWRNRIQMFSSFRLTTRTINLWLTASVSMYFLSFGFIEVRKDVFVALAAPMQRLVYRCLVYLHEKKQKCQNLSVPCLPLLL